MIPLLALRVSEFVNLGCFALVLGWAIKRKQWFDCFVLGSTALFGILLEFGSILAYDYYRYNGDFLLQIGQPPVNVPVCIGVGWAMILYAIMGLAEHLHVEPKFQPFFNATFAVLMVDAILDVVAVRFDGGFWTWDYALENGISASTYFGIPYSNFYGWWWVIFLFSGAIQLARHLYARSTRKGGVFFLVAPFLTYLPLYLMLSFRFWSYDLLVTWGVYADADAGMMHLHQLVLFLLSLGTGVGVSLWGRLHERKGLDGHEDRSAGTFREFILPQLDVPTRDLARFLAFLVSLPVIFVLMGIYGLFREIPGLILVAIIIACGHVYLQRDLLKRLGHPGQEIHAPVDPEAIKEEP